MRKVKLQVQMTVDGFIAGPNGEMDHLTWNWDEALKQYVTDFTDASDTILMGSVLYQGMSGHWPAIPPDNEQYAFAQKMNNYAKVVFSGSLRAPLAWNNSRLAIDGPATTIKQLKEQKGKDMLVYGGARFVSSLIGENLIDEYHLFINPVAIGKGLTIFGDLRNRLKLESAGAQVFDCGIVVMRYRPAKQ